MNRSRATERRTLRDLWTATPNLCCMVDALTGKSLFQSQGLMRGGDVPGVLGSSLPNPAPPRGSFCEGTSIKTQRSAFFPPPKLPGTGQARWICSPIIYLTTFLNCGLPGSSQKVAHGAELGQCREPAPALVAVVQLLCPCPLESPFSSCKGRRCLPGLAGEGQA